MIVSHRYRFIFIKTNKTASTSVEISLSRFCGRKDIITPFLTPEDEALRTELGYTGAQNYFVPETRGLASVWYKMIGKQNIQKKFYNHMSAREVQQLVPADIWNGYFKFCVERNPWDRVISSYYWRNRKEPRPSITTFLDEERHMRLKKFGWNNYTINGKIAVDRVVRFEKLREELESIRIQLGIPEPLELPYAKAGFRSDKRPYREVLNHEDQARIARDFSDEIREFGYRF